MVVVEKGEMEGHKKGADMIDWSIGEEEVVVTVEQEEESGHCDGGSENREEQVYNVRKNSAFFDKKSGVCRETWQKRKEEGKDADLLVELPWAADKHHTAGPASADLSGAREPSEE